MAEKRLNEEQMRAYVESEVRKALMEGRQDNCILNECINEAIDEGMMDEGVLDWLKTLLGNSVGANGQNPQGPKISMEGIIGAILGRFFAPVLEKLLNKIGIRPKSELGSVIVKAASTMGGYGLGQLVDKKWDPIGIDNGGFLGLGKGAGNAGNNG